MALTFTELGNASVAKFVFLKLTHPSSVQTRQPRKHEPS